MLEQFDPYHEWLGIPPGEQPPHHYRLLGITPFENKPNVIENAADQRMAHLKGFQAGKHGALSQKLLNEVAAARLCLLKSEKKVDYDAKLHELLDQQSVGEDTSTQLKGLQELGELLAREAARPTPRPQPKSSNTTLIVAVGGGVTLLVVIAGWVLLNRRTPKVAQVDKPTAAASWQSSTARSQPPAAEPVLATPLAANRELPQPPSGPPPSASTVQRTVAPPITKTEAKPTPEATQPAAKADTKMPEVATPAEPATPAQPTPTPPAAAVRLPSEAPESPKPPIPSTTPAKIPVPDDAALAAAVKTATEIYKDDYDKAHTSAALSALAKKVLQQMNEIKSDAAARFVFLRLARDIATKAGDHETTFTAIEQMAEGFTIDPWAMKAAFITGLAKQARVMNDHKAVAKQALAVLRDAQSHDAIAVAEELGKLALAEAGKARDKETVTAAREASKQVEQAAKAYKKVETALAVLKEKPDDPDANLLAGRYLCFVGGDWDRGLPLLAKGGQAGLKAVAEKERAVGSGQRVVANDSTPSVPLALADAWWDLAQQADSKDKEGMLLRAGYWYQQSGDEADTELVRLKIEKRMEAIAKLGRAIPEPPAGSAAQVVENSIGMKLTLIPAGEFLMGSTPEEIAGAIQEVTQQGDKVVLDRIRSETPKHRVRISRPFYLGTYEVTQGEYAQVMGSNPSSFSAKGKEAGKVAGQDTSRHAVEMVSLEDVAQFCQKLSALPKERAARRMYRLPTEAEWEYAARAGSTTKWSFGDDPAGLGEHAWFRDNAGSVTHPVGQKKPNAWGLYDSYGNVWEYCMDRYDETYYATSPKNDPAGPSSGSIRVIRGGGWSYTARYCRSATRGTNTPGLRLYALGFRVLLAISEDQVTFKDVPTTSTSASVPAQASEKPTARAESPQKVPNENPQQAAARLKLSVEETNSIGMTLMLIPTGEFLMGAPDSDGDAKPEEKPQHRVRITRPFYLSACPVTQAEYQRVMGNNPSSFSVNGKYATKVVGQDTSRHPVDTVSWDDAVQFCQKLSTMPEERIAGRVYRLPREAEWEYACRAGTTTRWSCGDEKAGLFSHAWLKGNCAGTTHPVGQKKPNPWGLYDMHGNIWQWCLDWYNQDYYKQTPLVDPNGPPGGTSHVMRGAPYDYPASTCRSSYRIGYAPRYSRYSFGFRVAVGL